MAAQVEGAEDGQGAGRRERTSTTERRAALKRQLLAAATAAIAADGLENLKARDLARDVGCAVGAIYNTVPDMDALVLEVNAATLAELDTELSGIGMPEPVAAMEAFASAYLAFALANPNLWRALFQHRMQPGAQVPDWYRAQQDCLFARLEGPLGKLRPELDRESARQLARGVFSAAHGVVALGLDEKLATVRPRELDAQLRTIVGAMACGLRA